MSSAQPNDAASTQEWVDWFYSQFLPHWIESARDSDGFGFYDVLDKDAKPLQHERRTLLAQARLLFTFSHLALKSNNPLFIEAAALARNALPAFEKSPGLYSRARASSKALTDSADDHLAYSYDQCFVILALSTWGQLNAAEDVDAELEGCWLAIENHLTDHTTGLLLEHDNLPNPLHQDAPPRAQNPHMHLYEAALQAHEMTQEPIWLNRAQKIRSVGLEYFYDKDNQTLIEFIAPDLKPLTHRAGQRREIGHQCEWAWLLCREVELGGDKNLKAIAQSLLKFADTHGFASNGPLKGLAFDAVSSDTTWREDTFLLWPQTEAIKTYAIRKDQPGYAEQANQLMLRVFNQYFANHAAFINQLDNNNQILWPEALSRLLYHIVLALTEGDRAGLWKTPVN